MSYDLMQEEAILQDLALKFEHLRLKKRVKDQEIEKIGGVSRRILYNFRSNTTAITLKSFIRLLKGIGELDRLEKLLEDKQEYSPINSPQKELPKRVRDRKKDNGFIWGDEE